MADSKTEQDPDSRETRRGRPAHPVWHANLLMAGVVLLLLLISVLSVVGGR